MSARCSAVIKALASAIDGELARIRHACDRPLSVLDVGCWDGATAVRYASILGGQARGIEVFPAQAARAGERGIDVASIDLELEPFPWADASVDVVVANQVFEHLKNVWLPMSEVARVIAPGGHLVFSVPNLSSMHNRVMLGFGYQPSSIRTFGPHVRGFTYRQAREFVEYERYFQIVRTTGVGFYPLPTSVSGFAARAWVAGSHTPIIVARRIAPTGAVSPWHANTTAPGVGEQTFYGGAGPPGGRRND